MTANQLAAYNLRRARTLHGWTQEQVAERLEPYIGKKWSKATFSAAERSAETDARTREFSADELLAFARVFGVPVGWFFLPPEGDDELPAISCGGPREVEPRELIDAALPHASWDSPSGPRLGALMRRAELRGASDERIREGVHARVQALAATASVPNVTTHAANLRSLANALEAAEDAAQILFVDEFQKEEHDV